MVSLPIKEADLQYDLGMMVDLIVADFQQQDSDKWFSLKEAVSSYGKKVGLRATIMSYGFTKPPEEYPILIRDMATRLRGEGLFVAPREWIGGSFSTSVWRTKNHYGKHASGRAEQGIVAKSSGLRRDYDLRNKWRIEGC